MRTYATRNGVPVPVSRLTNLVDNALIEYAAEVTEIMHNAKSRNEILEALIGFFGELDYDLLIDELVSNYNREGDDPDYPAEEDVRDNEEGM